MPERPPGRLRLATVLDQPRALAERALRGVPLGVAPLEPIHVRDVPLPPVMADHLEGLPQHPGLPVEALVQVGAPGRTRSPPQLGGPELGRPVAVTAHHRAHPPELEPEQPDVRRVWMQCDLVELPLDVRDAIEPAEELPGT